MLIPPLFDLSSRPRHESPRSSPLRRHGKTRGFALLITITLLAFLVLLLVSLASLTRVETQVAGNNQQLSQARQNALMALNIALGQLQKYAGPDQRVTAIADIKGTASGTADATLKNPYYTGVWDATPADPIKPPILNSGTPLAWLVSSNTATPTVPTADYSAAGALLVGPNTVLNTTQYVYAPKVPITSTQVPGLGSTPATIGNYAYWIEDEGVKARVNLTDSFAPYPAGSGGTPAFTPSTTQAAARLSAAQRFGVETISGLTDLNALNNEDADAVTARDNLNRILAYGQMPIFDTAFSQTATVQRLHELYHDLSAVSNGVLTDTVNGGLRADLTYLFQQSTAANFQTELNKVLTGNDAIGNPGQSNPTNTGLVPKLAAASTAKYSWSQGPTWYQLRSFYLSGSLAPAGALNAAGEAAPRAQQPDVHGIYPIITQFRLRVGAQGRLISAGVYRLEGVFSPLVVLANPYNVTIAAADYLVKTEFYGGSQLTLKNTPLLNWGSVYADTIYYKIKGFALAPGQARVYTLRAGDTTAGWDAALGCYTWANAGRYPLENDLNLDDCRIAVTSFSSPLPTATSAELAAGVSTNNINVHGEYRVYLYLDNGSLLNPAASQLLQRVQASINGNGTIGNGGIDIGTITQSSPSNYFLQWPAVASDSLGFYLMSPLDSPGVNMYQSTNWRAYNRSKFGSSAFSTRNTGIYFANPTGWRTNMLIASDNQTVLWGMRNRGSNTPANDSPSSTSAAPAALTNAIFFDVPTATTPIISLGQLQHFNDSGFTISASPGAEVDNVVSTAATYAIGNSDASPYVSVTAYDQVDTLAPSGGSQNLIKDASYLLNRTLWDTYFFSTVPQAGNFDFKSPTDLLGNPRLVPFRSTLASNAIGSYRSGPLAAAANLLLKGGFNINSTSLVAWEALFASLNQIPYPATTTKLTGAFARTLKQTSGSPGTTTGDNGVSAGAWSGYRNLSAGQITALATEMVKQVRMRGPFASLADFVNRRVDNTAYNQTGALEAAIQATETSSSPINNLSGGKAAYPLYFNSPTGTGGAIIGKQASSGVDGIPGILKQADLLQALGPVITARSDTFTIRAYGERVNPLDSTTVMSRAWCEAVVQRLPDYIGGESADTAPALLPSASSSVSFGRRFQIISFRWLNSGDI